MTAGMAFEACLAVIHVLRRLDVDHLVAGSLASSFHGTPRSTQDVDLVADLHLGHVPLLVAALESSFYVDVERVRNAVRHRKSFNVILLRTMFKVDVFVMKDDPLAREEMRRRQRVVIDEESGEAIDVASAEDTILQKLDWYRLGGGTSDRQWNDLLGVFKVRRGLDWDYLERWADHLGVRELLQRAAEDAGLREPDSERPDP